MQIVQNQLTDQPKHKMSIIHMEASEKLKQSPKYSYEPKYRGEAASLMELCDNEQIISTFSFGKVRIFSKNKIPRFLELVNNNLSMHKERFGLTYPIHKWKAENHQVFCVGIGKEESIWTYESALTKVVVNQFRGAIPVVKNIMICNTRDEMLEKLIMKGVII